MARSTVFKSQIRFVGGDDEVTRNVRCTHLHRQPEGADKCLGDRLRVLIKERREAKLPTYQIEGRIMHSFSRMEWYPL